LGLISWFELFLIFTARRYVSAVYAIVMCPSVCPSQAGTVQKRLNEHANNDIMITQGL